MLSAFVVAQIVFDVAVVAVVAVYVLTRKAPPRVPDPPEWYGQFLKLAHDLMTATEPVLERLESREPAVVAAAGPAAAPAPDRYEQARALLRAGTPIDTVAGRAGLSPGEVRLLAKVVAAESRRRSS